MKESFPANALYSDNKYHMRAMECCCPRNPITIYFWNDEPPDEPTCTLCKRVTEKK
jgi:hypothetical protein